MVAAARGTDGPIPHLLLPNPEAKCFLTLDTAERVLKLSFPLTNMYHFTLHIIIHPKAPFTCDPPGPTLELRTPLSGQEKRNSADHHPADNELLRADNEELRALWRSQAKTRTHTHCDRGWAGRSALVLLEEI
jgi:hypothetical protein